MDFNKSVLVRGSASDGDDVYYMEGFCDSSETKPTGTNASKIADGSILCESNTGDVYFFNAKTSAWVKQFSFQG